MDEQFSVALESIQGKRRIELVMEAAHALLGRYEKQSDIEERLKLTYELIRRNFTEEIVIEFGSLTLGTDGFAESDAVSGAADHDRPDRTEFHSTIRGPDGRTGTLTAYYTEPGSMGLTSSEWLAALRLLAGISGLGVGGIATCTT